MSDAVRPRRILMVLSHSLHIRNFVAAGVVERLVRRGHPVCLVVPADFVARVRGEVGPGGRVEPMGPYLGGCVRERLRAVFRTASYVARAHLSTYRHKLRVRSVSPAAVLEAAVLRLAGRAVDLERLARGVEARLPIAPRARRLVEVWRPEVVVVPTFIHDTLDLELVKAARQRGVPVVSFPASWDTLTSKGCYLVEPDAVMVWGEDSFRHAVDYHGFPPERVVVTGPPHFDVYAPAAAGEPRERFLARHGIPADRRLLLFAGTTVTYWADEPAQLRALSDLVVQGELADVHIWYRPHPRRNFRDVSDLRGLPGVHVDEQVVRQQEKGGYSIERDDLDHYRRLLDASDGVITAFSTMIIEAALMGKPSLVVAFGLGDQTPERLLQHAEYEHMRDVISTPGVTLCRSFPEVVRGIRGIREGAFAPLAEALRKRAGEIAHALDGGARDRVVRTIERVAAREWR